MMVHYVVKSQAVGIRMEHAKYEKLEAASLGECESCALLFLSIVRSSTESHASGSQADMAANIILDLGSQVCQHFFQGS